jgi:Asp-tRNA(Asn)/Glu-tRNA(Gln) amidotransferase A subunit family amidase
VAVAAGLVPVALATDFGSSIAVPSAFCGIFGMKPSPGRVPQWPIDVLELSTVGPLARSIDDIALVMNIITKPDVRDGTCLPYNYVDYTQIFNNSFYGKRIACINSINGAQVNTEIIKYLEFQKSQIDFISLDFEIASEIFSKLAESKWLYRWLNIPKEHRHLTGRNVQHRAILAQSPDNVHAPLIDRYKLITQLRKIMQSYDVLIGPATDSNKQTDTAKHISPLSVFFSITKQPTITVPIGLDSNSMPQSVMVAGAMHDDLGVLQLAHAIEKQFPMPHPPLFYSKGSLCKNEILNNA